MNFELSEDQVAFSDMARTFAQNELEPRAAEGGAEMVVVGGGPASI